MKAIALNEMEWELLAGLPHMQFRLYLVLRWHMDIATSIVGSKRRISRQGLLEELYVEPIRGRRSDMTGSPSIQALRSALDGLEKSGLIEPRGSGELLVFSLPKARSAQARSKDQQPISNRGQQPDQQPGKRQAPQCFGEDQQPDQQPGSNSDQQPTSGVRVNHSVVNAAAALPKVVDARDFVLLPLHIAEWLREAEKRRGKIVCVAETDALLKSWSIEGVQLDDLRAAHAAAVADREARKEPAPIAPGFLRIFLERHLKKTGGSANVPWFKSSTGIEAKGRALGLALRQGEQFRDFKLRVYAAAGMTEDEARRWKA